MDTTIKIDYKAFCRQIIDNTKYIYNLSDDETKKLPLDIPFLVEWQQKVQDDFLVENLKQDNLDVVVEILKHRR